MMQEMVSSRMTGLKCSCLRIKSWFAAGGGFRTRVNQWLTKRSLSFSEGRGGATDLHDRNIAGWRRDPKEVPPELPEKHWRELVTSTYKGLSHVEKNDEECMTVLRKRLIHACKNRGWAEMSNFCYEFAQETDNLEVFVFDELKQLERILLADDLFLMALVTGKKQVPEEFEGRVMDMLIQFAQSRTPR